MSQNEVGKIEVEQPKEQQINVADYVPGQPRFVIRCQKCRWAVVNGGMSKELKGLHEIPNNCPTCGKARQFKCPKCGRPAKMTRVKGA